MKDVCIIDGGARFGIHDSWVPLFRSDAKFRMFLFEPDKEEAQFLNSKYLEDQRITVVHSALGEAIKDKVVFNKPEHGGGTTEMFFAQESNYFKKMRPGSNDLRSKFFFLSSRSLSILDIMNGECSSC